MMMQAMKSTKLRSAVYVLMAALVLVMATQALARGSSTPTDEKEITGVVTAIDLTTVTIGTMTFDIAQAEVPVTTVPGDLVKVHYTVATDGTLVARELQLAVDVTPESTMEDSPEGTPEATEAFDDHGQDNPATHIEDQQGAQGEVGDDNGQDNPATHIED